MEGNVRGYLVHRGRPLEAQHSVRWKQIPETVKVPAGVPPNLLSDRRGLPHTTWERKDLNKFTDNRISMRQPAEK